MAALARHWLYIQLTSSAPFQSSPREGNKAGHGRLGIAPSRIDSALVALIVGIPGGAMEGLRHVTKIHCSGE